MSNTVETTEQTTIEKTSQKETIAEQTTNNNNEDITETTVNTSDESGETQTTGDGETLETTTSITGVQDSTLGESLAKDSMSIPFIGLSILQCVIAFMLIVVVLQQSKTASAMASSALSGVSAETDSYWNKNKGRSKEGKLARMTVILGVIFFILTLILGFLK